MVIYRKGPCLIGVGGECIICALLWGMVHVLDHRGLLQYSVWKTVGPGSQEQEALIQKDFGAHQRMIYVGKCKSFFCFSFIHKGKVHNSLSRNTPQYIVKFNMDASHVVLRFVPKWRNVGLKKYFFCNFILHL